MGVSEEQKYHDNIAKEIDINSLLIYESFEAVTAPENRYILQLLNDIKDKNILDLGCGSGETSLYFAIKGANVTALDVSEGMISVGQRLAQKHDVQIRWMVTDATVLPFENEEFDIVYGNSVLHHLPDLSLSLREIRRVLKPGGIAVFIEPLAHNPVIKIYRQVAKEVRTEDEAPFKIKEVEKLFRNEFGNCRHEEFWFFTLWLFIKFFLIERVNPNKERYWKKIIREHQRLSKLYNRLEKMDKKVLSAIPFLKRYCWNTVIFARKGA